MVAAKHDRAHIGLAGQFSVHSVDRVYEAVVWGVPAAGQARSTGRSAATRSTACAWPSCGKGASARSRVGDCWRPAEPARRGWSSGWRPAARTRSVQQRLGHPIVGDRLYGRGRDAQAPAVVLPTIKKLDRIMLHARHLSAHPVTGEALAFEAPPPGDVHRRP